MTLKIRSTRVACATSNGTQDITITDFGTPKAAMFILSRATADATATDEAAISIGFTDGTRNRGIRWLSQHGADTSDVYAGESATYCIEMYDNAGDEEAAGAFSAWITNGVRINWTNAPPSGYLLTVVLLGGTDLANAYVNHFAIDTTQNNTVDVTDPGFKPTDVLTLKVLTGYRNIIVGSVHNTSGDVVTQSSGGISERDNRGTSELVGACQTAYGSFELGASTLLGRFEFGSFDANGFSCTTRETSATAGNILYLALQITTYDSYTSSFTTPTSTGNQGQTGPGFKPQFLMQLGTNMDAVNTAYTDNRGGAFGVFVADATAQYSNMVAAEDGADTTNTESQSDDQMAVLHDDDGSALIATTFVSFDATGWTQNFTAVSATGKVWLVWAVEEEEASGITEEIGLATETDTPQAITKVKSKALGLSTESDTPLAMVTAKTRAIGLATETETVFGLVALKTRTIGLAAEADTPLGIVLPTIQAIGLATETDTVLSLTALKTRTIGLATESDAALAMAAAKARAIGLATETDTPLAVIAAGATTIGLATETDTPLALTALKTKALGLAAESDTVLAAVVVKSRTLGLATETDTTLALAMLKAFTLGLLTETDTPLGLLTGAIVQEIGLVVETNTIFSLTAVKSYPHWRPKPNRTGYDRHLDRIANYYDTLRGRRR